MIDLHTHLLPAMDDGSSNVEESIALLDMLRAQGIEAIAATPHFYPEENSPEEFLFRREQSFARMSRALKGDFPVALGAEVHYFSGIGQSDEIKRLCISSTDLLLLEMPFQPWSHSMVRDVEELGERQNIQVVLAHIERYMRWQNGLWPQLLKSGVLMQCNASFFLNWRTKRKACAMLKKGQIHFIGSDCHNITVRPPRMGEALRAVGQDGRRLLHENIEKYAPELGGGRA